VQSQAALGDVEVKQVGQEQKKSEEPLMPKKESSEVQTYEPTYKPQPKPVDKVKLKESIVKKSVELTKKKEAKKEEIKVEKARDLFKAKKEVKAAKLDKTTLLMEKEKESRQLDNLFITMREDLIETHKK